MFGGEPLEHIGPELPGRGDRDPTGHVQPMTIRGRRLASASRLASGVVRSRIRTPSRWSDSCWATREYGSSSSYRTRAPCSSCPSIAIFADRSTGSSTPWIERQPSSSTVVTSPRSTISGFASATVSSSETWKTKKRCRTPTWVAASPIPLASAMSCFMRSTRRRRSSSNSSTGRAVIFSAASGYWRICDSASRRRACCSGSSSSSLTCPSISAMTGDCTLADVDPRTLQEIMGQGATRPETPQDRREREQLEADLESSPARGKPLRQRLRNFRPDPTSGVQALGGPTAWMRRLRAIEDSVEQHERQLAESWHSLAEELADPAEFTAAWLELAGNWSFARVNELIERHNRNFPAEARLAMDPRTRNFVRVNGRSYLREPLDVRWILERFPADRETVLSG